MLLIIDSPEKLDFRGLKEVYSRSLLKAAQKNRKDISSEEQKFRRYLQQEFFRLKGAVYYIWEEEGVYRSALRMEPFEDGALITGLETHPDFRGKGYGSALMAAVLACDRVPDRVYSHIAPANTASMKLHEKFGFTKILDFGRMIDGSIRSGFATFRFCKKSG